MTQVLTQTLPQLVPQPDTRWMRPSAHPGLDPLHRACERLREMAATFSEPAKLRDGGTKLIDTVVEVRSAVRLHVWREGHASSSLDMIEREVPRLRAAAERQRREHVVHSEMVDDLYQAALVSADSAGRVMAGLDIQAAELATTLERHHHQFVEVLYEASHRDLGGMG